MSPHRQVFSVIVLTGVIAVIGCKAPPGKGAFNKDQGEQRIAAMGVTPEAGTGSYAMSENRGDISKARHVPELDANVLYFAFDSSVIATGERSKLEAVAAYFKKHAEENLLVEGHCDERGTQEYNRALGERRAQACREFLIQTGLPARRIQTISYGKDRPADPGHDEAAWGKNRRAEFLTY
jgi:peptidoglycan-associated lipoprotein